MREVCHSVSQCTEAFHRSSGDAEGVIHHRRRTNGDGKIKILILSTLTVFGRPLAIIRDPLTATKYSHPNYNVSGNCAVNRSESKLKHFPPRGFWSPSTSPTDVPSRRWRRQEPKDVPPPAVAGPGRLGQKGPVRHPRFPQVGQIMFVPYHFKLEFFHKKRTDPHVCDLRTLQPPPHSALCPSTGEKSREPVR